MHRWSTCEHSPAAQFSYWREVLCEAFTALDAMPHRGTIRQGGFDSRVTTRPVHDLLVARLRSQAQHVRRGPKEIIRQPAEYFFLNRQWSGSCVVRQDGRELLVRPGDLYLVDTTRPYDIIQDEDHWQSLSIRVPHQLLAPSLADPRRVTALRINSSDSVGMLTANYAQTLSGAGEVALRGSSEALLASTLVQLLLESIQPAGAQDQGARTAALKEGQYEAILRHIDGHLADPHLSAQSVAQAFRMSTRYLHKLFEHRVHTFHQVVLSARLSRCAAELADPLNREHISVIAFRWGFGDLSHFCKVFRKHLGQTPSAFRHGARG